jgi:hypothetical protein
MLNFPLNVLSPSLLTHPAQAPTAFDDLKGREILGVVVESHERSRCEELENAVRRLAGLATKFGPKGLAASAVDAENVVG